MAKKRKATASDNLSEREEAFETRVEELNAREAELKAQAEKLKAHESKLKVQAEKLKAREEELRLDRENFDLERSAYHGNTRPTDVLKLNIGGKKTTVLRSTLTCVPGSMLASQFSGRWDDSIEKDDEGNFVIDQDFAQFGLILSFLRQKVLLGDDKDIVHPSLDEHGPNFRQIVEYYGLVDSMYPVKLQEAPCWDKQQQKVEIHGLKCSVSGERKRGAKPNMFILDPGCHERRVKAIEVKIGRPANLGLCWHQRIEEREDYDIRIGIGIYEESFEFLIKGGEQCVEYSFCISDFVRNSSEDIVLRSEDYGRLWYINGKLLEGQDLFDEFGDLVEGKTLQNAIDEFIEKNCSSSTSFSSSFVPHVIVGECEFEVTHYEFAENGSFEQSDLR